MKSPLRKIKEKFDALKFGRKGEKLAARLLRKKGYKILETNYRRPAGEIDLIARDGKTLVFCEVKSRRSRAFGSALESVTPSKIKRIRKTADDYIRRHGLNDIDCRFDVVTVEEGESGIEIEIIPNAF